MRTGEYGESRGEENRKIDLESKSIGNKTTCKEPPHWKGEEEKREEKKS